MKHLMLALACALAIASGCSKKADAPKAEATHEHDGHGDHEGMHEGHEGMHDEEAMPAELGKFHDVLKPLWHAPAGDKRTADTCAAIPAMAAQADAVAKAPPPKADAAKFGPAAKGLVDAVAALKAPCDAKDGPGFDAAFKNVHEAFHAALAAAGSVQ